MMDQLLKVLIIYRVLMVIVHQIDSQLKRKYLLTQRLNKAMTLQVEHMISDVQSKHGMYCSIVNLQ